MNFHGLRTRDKIFHEEKNTAFMYRAQAFPALQYLAQQSLRQSCAVLNLNFHVPFLALQIVCPRLHSVLKYEPKKCFHYFREMFSWTFLVHFLYL